MKITNIIPNKIISSVQKVTRPFKQRVKFQPVQDVFVRRSRPAEIAADNILIVKKVGFNDYVFMDGKKKIGSATININTREYGSYDVYPVDWFDESVAPNLKGNHKLKPYMYITEFSMNDRINKKTLEKRDKKYGTMAMQHLLAIAKASGCEHRIELYAGQLGHTKFMPGRFYHKMGFSLPYKVNKELEKMEHKYNKELAKLLKNGVPEDEARKILEIKDLYLPEKKDGRYIADYGKMFMTNPECAMNYPLK